MKSGICPKCQSQNVIPHVRILDYYDALGASNLKAVVYENPNALFFSGEHKSSLTAWICGECGYTELFVDRPQELFAVYYASLRARGTPQTETATAGPTWVCPSCSEQIEENFDVCWNCGTDRDGAPPTDPTVFNKLKDEL